MSRIAGALIPGQRVSDQTEESFTSSVSLINKLNVAGGQLICSNIPIGSVALASIGTNTTDIIQLWVTDILVPYNRIVSNISYLSGGTATTDYILAAIYDSYGRLVASTSLAGQLVATANIWQTQAVALVYPASGVTSVVAGVAATSVQLYGPQQYFVALQGNGTTAGAIQTVPAPYQICAGIIAAGTFGTIPATITVPTTFTAAKGPIIYLS
jgi:hypothetical protein